MHKKISFAAVAVLAFAEYAVADGFSRPAGLDGLPDRQVMFSVCLEELVSARGESERYSSCRIGENDVWMDSRCIRRGGADAWDARVAVTNLSGRARFLRLVVKAGIPFNDYEFWNGFLNQSDRTKSWQGKASLGLLFPAIAAIGEGRALVLGFDPMLLASRIDTTCEKEDGGDFLQIAFPIYLPPRDGFDACITLSSTIARYSWRDVIELWYRLYPSAFAPKEDVHPGAKSAYAGQIFWSPAKHGIDTDSGRAAAIRKHFGEYPTWDWCYRPFVRAGDWAITDEWSCGWKYFTKDTLEEWRSRMRSRLSSAKRLDVAPMWYLNVTYTEKSMALSEFPGITRGTPKIGKYWSQSTVGPIYSAGGTAYEKLFRDSISRIAREYPDAKGIAWDSCFANSEIPETHIGFAGTPCKSFRDGVPFAHEGVGIAGLLDFNHRHFTGAHRMANVVNYKLPAPWMVSVRTDAALYEGTAVTRRDWMLRHESHRARLGGRKVMSWSTGCSMERLKWAGFSKMSPEEAKDAHLQILDDLLFLSYYWGVAVSPTIRSENTERLVGALKELVGLIMSGWHPSPGCDVPEGILAARYGEGDGTRIAVINPGYEKAVFDLSLPEDYWPQWKGGKKMALQIPARQVLVVNPNDGEARAIATKPPKAAKKIVEPELLHWLKRDGLVIPTLCTKRQ